MKTNEKGIAIPTVLVALVALTALGLAMSVATQGDVVVSGVQQRSMESFHAADGGINPPTPRPTRLIRSTGCLSRRLSA